jgi:serine/threonine protein phosphatase PrpC
MGVLTLRVVANIHPGQERDYQEDNFIIGIDPTREDWNVIKTEQYSPNEWGSMLVLADGMGGLNAGEVASQKAVDGYKEYILQRRGSAPPYAHAQALLVDAILHANKKILDYAVDNPETKGMGTTIVAAWIVQDMMHLAWSGDSRCYIYNSGHLRQINSDHSYVQELVNKKEISPEDAFYHPKKNIITQSLGDVGLAPSPEYRSEKLRDGDRILLCSDGLNSMLMDEQIEAYMAGSDIRDCANQLVDAANRAGGFDNITVLLAEVLSVGDAAVIPEPLEQIGGNGGSVVPSPSGKTLINFKLTKKTAKSIFLALLVLALGAIVWFSIKISL